MVVATLAFNAAGSLVAVMAAVAVVAVTAVVGVVAVMTVVVVVAAMVTGRDGPGCDGHDGCDGRGGGAALVASVAVTVVMAITAVNTVVAGVEAPAVFNNSERSHKPIHNFCNVSCFIFILISASIKNFSKRRTFRLKKNKNLASQRNRKNVPDHDVFSIFSDVYRMFIIFRLKNRSTRTISEHFASQFFKNSRYLCLL